MDQLKGSLVIGTQSAVSFSWVVDAHADYKPPQRRCRNMHGMSAAFLCGEHGAGLPLGVSRAKRRCDQLELFGVRSSGPTLRTICCAAAESALPIGQIDAFRRWRLDPPSASKR